MSPRRSPRARLTSLLAVLALAVVVLPTALEAQAQATTGIIRGLVRDPTGAPVETAEVVLENQETGLVRRLATNARGIFVATLLPTGTYDVTVRAVGQFGDIQRQDIALRLGETVDLDLEFEPVEVEELVVTGIGEAPLVDPTDVTSSTRLSEVVVKGLPNNGRDFLDFTLLTPGVTIVQGPDGEEISVAGQRGIFNNVIVDGADFNNPFFGEQRGGQRPAFTFNLDAVEEMVVVNAGAPAEFGRSAGGFVNVLTKSGTNEFEGSVHYFGQFDEISSNIPGCGTDLDPETAEELCDFPFNQSQFGVTLGGPIVRDKAFFFVAYDQQEASSTKQLSRTGTVVDDAAFQQLQDFLQDEFGGALAQDFGPVERTDDNRALMAKLDWNVSERHKAAIKYNYTWSEQVNGTFDVDSWGRSANGIEKDFSHAVNGQLSSQLSDAVSNEFRFQWAREDRPRPYEGPLMPGAEPPGLPQFEEIGGKPFPDTGMTFADGFRFGLPFFLPIEPAFDTRIQLLDNISFLRGNHLFKVGAEWNRTTIEQQFLGFANGRFIFDSVDGFINYVNFGPDFVTCSDGSSSMTGSCPAGTSITGPLLLFLQSATVPPIPTSQLGLQSFEQNEVALFIQDTWKPSDNLTINAGVRWEGAWQPGVFIAPEETFYAPFIGTSREGANGEGPFEFPSDGTIPDDLNNFQPRFGMTWDVEGDGRRVVRLSAGSYFARIPSLVFAQHRTTNGAFQQVIAGGSAFGTIPEYGELLETEGLFPFFPTIQVPSTELELPRTWQFTGEYKQMIGDFVAASVNYQHARGDNLFRFIDRNHPVFGSPWGSGLPSAPGAGDDINGIFPFGGDSGGLIVTESTARSRYHGLTWGLAGRGIANDRVQFDLNYTLSWDKSDDDNERDPFTFRYVLPNQLDREFNWSDRDRRHQVNAYLLTRLPGNIILNNIVRAATAQPASEVCGENNQGTGERASVVFTAASDRLCPDGSILRRNTIRKRNDFFEWDLRASKVFPFGRSEIEVIGEVFNVTNTNNFLDTDPALLFNFDGTIRSGLSDPRRVQVGAKFRWGTGPVGR